MYDYAAPKLWTAYGLAIGFTALTVIAGFWALFVSGASYSDDFSTVFRVAHGATMAVKMNPEDTNGASPLPEHLKKAEVWLSPSITGAVEGNRVVPETEQKADGHEP